MRLSLKSIWQGSPRSTTAGIKGHDEIGSAPMLAPVLDGVIFVVNVAFEADNDIMLGFNSVRKLGENEGDREMSDCDGDREMSDCDGNRKTSDDEGRQETSEDDGRRETSDDGERGTSEDGKRETRDEDGR